MSRKGLIVVAAVWAASLGHAQTTWHVDAAGTPPGSGSMADPYTSIQFALAQGSTVAGDTVLVAPGTYFENLDFLGKDVTLVSSGGRDVTVVDGLDLGSVVTFANGETSAAVLDGFTVYNGQVSLADGRGGGIACTGASPTLRNLNVIGNRAAIGAGIYLESSSASLSDSFVQGNGAGCVQANYLGAGIYSTCDSSPLVERCEILGNGEAARGGGIHGGGTYVECGIRGNRGYNGGGAYSAGCTLVLVDCELESNRNFGCKFPGGPGGGGYGPATLTGCSLWDNWADLAGGGAHQATLTECQVFQNRVFAPNILGASGGGTSECVLTDCDIYDNSNSSNGPSPGGGVYGGTATRCRIFGNRASASITSAGYGARGAGAYGAVLVECEIFDNEAIEESLAMQPTGGGGIAFCDAQRCLIYGNSASRGGGVLGGSIEHCVVYGNTGTVDNGGVQAQTASGSPSTSVLNSVLWGNTLPSVLPTAGSLSVTYSDVEGGFAGTGNFDLSPGFWDAPNADFRPMPGSPCIDAGDPASPLDPDGSIADAGVYPFDPDYNPSGTWTYCTAKVNSQGCTPRIGSSGTPSLTGPDDFVVTAVDVRNEQRGVLFYGFQPDALPFYGGTLCTSVPVRRYVSQGSGGSAAPVQDCTGAYGFFVSQAYLASIAAQPGQSLYFQILYRDPPHPDGTGVGLTDGLVVTFAP